ncbi:hypothetical protein BDQ17DRAFT_1337831 [Cyathus striatus]|nr:hypothetical protein BDQ17DRAFT_1337831 [Cyathus striatus]
MSYGSKSRYNSHAFHDPDYERRIQAAIEGTTTLPKKYKNLKQAAKALDGKLSYKDAATNHRLLNPSEEQAFLDWIKNDAESGQPWDNCTLCDRATDLAGRRAGKCFASRLISRHPELVPANPSKLDPKRAKNFNETVVSDFFNKLNSIYEQYGDISLEQIYNMDEKGIQLGGGRKNDPRKYMYFRDQRNRYKISSDNLELVTIVKCVSAAGTSVPPSFMLSDGPLPNLSELPDGSIGRHVNYL